MGRKVILSADSTCDIGPELQERYNVQLQYSRIQLGEKSYVEQLEITPDDLYKAWYEQGKLPKTSAITPAAFCDSFHPWVKQGYDVLHLTIGSGISSTYQNCCVAAQSMEHVYPVDSANLSTGFGHLVIQAAELLANGASAAEAQQQLTKMRTKAHASFVLDTLEFMSAGGRCSAVAAFGANLLKLKPGVEVDNTAAGKMGVGKKYRGNMEKVLPEYVKTKLQNRNDLQLDRVFITHSGSPESDIALVKREIAKYADFKETFVTRAGCVVSSHCGPRTLGVLFMTI